MHIRLQFNEYLVLLYNVWVHSKRVFGRSSDDAAIRYVEFGAVPRTRENVAREFAFCKGRSSMSASCVQAIQSTVQVDQQDFDSLDTELFEFARWNSVRPAESHVRQA